jgi:hypothetical protein
MTGAEIGVGRVVAEGTVVHADRGVVRSEEDVLGDSRLALMGESSTRTGRHISAGVLPERRWFKERFDTRGGGRVLLDWGMTRGARLLGDSGPEILIDRGAYASLMAASSSASSSSNKSKKVSAGLRGLALPPGALAERSCRGGRPGIVAAARSGIVASRMLAKEECRRGNRRTRVHGDFLNSGHMSSLGNADLAPAVRELVLVDPNP